MFSGATTVVGSYYLVSKSVKVYFCKTRCRCFSLERAMVFHTDFLSVVPCWDSKLRNLEAKVIPAFKGAGKKIRNYSSASLVYL